MSLSDAQIADEVEEKLGKDSVGGTVLWATQTETLFGIYQQISIWARKGQKTWPLDI